MLLYFFAITRLYKYTKGKTLSLNINKNSCSLVLTGGDLSAVQRFASSSIVENSNTLKELIKRECVIIFGKT